MPTMPTPSCASPDRETFAPFLAILNRGGFTTSSRPLFFFLLPLPSIRFSPTSLVRASLPRYCTDPARW